MVKAQKIIEAAQHVVVSRAQEGWHFLVPPVKLTHFAGASSEKWSAGIVGISGDYTGKVYLVELGGWFDAGDFDIAK